jgi:hypothetical protein
MAMVKAAQWLTNQKKADTSHKFYRMALTIFLSPQMLLWILPIAKRASKNTVMK